MSGWILRGIRTAGDGAYDVLFQDGDDERTFRFTANEITVGAEPLLTFRADEFEAETIYTRPSARTVIQAVTAFHRATVEPVLFAPAGEPPDR